jgi:uncharacterized membrane protein (UPF0136 family)
MNLGIVAAIAYGILALVGGIIGYRQAQSKASLVSGAISGDLLILGGVLRSLGQSWGLVLAIIVTVALVGVFAIRLAKTRKFMPAGLMTVVGVAALVMMIRNL